MALPVFRSVRSVSSPAPVPVPSPYEDSYWNSLAQDYDSIDADSVFEPADRLDSKVLADVFSGPNSSNGDTAKSQDPFAHVSEHDFESSLMEAVKQHEQDKKDRPQNNFFAGPDEEPVFVEKYNSFISESTAPTLLDAIDCALQECGAETEQRLSKYKVKAQASGQENPCSFIARIYRSRKQSGKLVVEFQRRSGCTVQFNQIYRRAVSRLNQIDSAHVAEPYSNSCTLDLKLCQTSELGEGEKEGSGNCDVSSTPWRVFQHQHHFVNNRCNHCSLQSDAGSFDINSDSEGLSKALSLTR